MSDPISSNLWLSWTLVASVFTFGLIHKCKEHMFDPWFDSHKPSQLTWRERIVDLSIEFVKWGVAMLIIVYFWFRK